MLAQEAECPLDVGAIFLIELKSQRKRERGVLSQKKGGFVPVAMLGTKVLSIGDNGLERTYRQAALVRSD